MKQYDFTLKFALEEKELENDELVERLCVAGCDDALVGSGQYGRIALNFLREAPSAIDAIRSAISDVQQAIPTARLVEAIPDLVGLTDIADLLGFSRQNMRKFVARNGSDFPLPVHEGKPAIWHLSKVLLWFAHRKARQIDETLIELSEVNMQCNLLRESGDIDPKLSKQLKHLIA